MTTRQQVDKVLALLLTRSINSSDAVGQLQAIPVAPVVSQQTLYTLTTGYAQGYYSSTDIHALLGV